MANIIWDKTVGLEEKVFLMRQDARFDIDDGGGDTPDFSAIRREIRSRPQLPQVPKVFLSNDCVFNCAYCGCRAGNDCKRTYASTPRELAELSVREASEGNRGIFLTSAIYKNPDYTQELIIETLRLIRQEMGFRGYVHAKVMPGADTELIRAAGRYANRLSVNIEVARSEGYTMVAKNKNKDNILKPMGDIARLIRSARQETGRFSPVRASSQTTQLMAGSSGEDDYTILNLSGALYKKYGLKRVYYTPFQYRTPAVGYDNLEPVATPHWRMSRLYQADRLMQLYGFTAEEITPESAPFLTEELDPKAAWALRNLHLFPIEVNTADYESLMRIPGIGQIYAQRIMKARKYCTVTHDVLKSLGVSLRRSGHFLTCKGRHQGASPDNEALLYRILADRPPIGLSPESILDPVI